MELFAIHPPFLVDREIWKCLLFAYIFFTFFQCICIAGSCQLVIRLNNIISYSVKVPF